MKPTVLLLNPILIPAINEKLDALYNVLRYFEHDDKDALIREHGGSIRGVVTGGHAGIKQALMERLPALQVVAVNGVGSDAVDLDYARSRGIHVSATLGALTEDVADMAVGLLIAACRSLFTGDRYVRAGDWPPPVLPLARRFSGMRVGIVGLGRVGRAIATRAAAFVCPISYTDLKPHGRCALHVRRRSVAARARQRCVDPCCRSRQGGRHHQLGGAGRARQGRFSGQCRARQAGQ